MGWPFAALVAACVLCLVAPVLVMSDESAAAPSGNVWDEKLGILFSGVELVIPTNSRTVQSVKLLRTEAKCGQEPSTHSRTLK